MNFAVKASAIMVFGLASVTAAAELTFDDVIKAAQEVKSYQYTETIFQKDRPSFTSKWFFKKPGITRTEYGNGTIGIDAHALNKCLMINPKNKTVQILIQMKDRPPYQIKTDGSSMLAGRIRGWKKLFDKLENLGEKIVDGKKAVGFRLSGKNGERTIWIDPETKLPFKEEILVIRNDPFGPSNTEDKRVAFDYVYNPKMDESLFSLTPPEGYKVEEHEVMMTLPIEKDFTQGLKVCAELNDNQFPDELTMKYLMDFVENKKQGQAVYHMLTFARMQHFEKHNWRYVGRGVKLGEKNKPVYWYQPEDGKPYRVVYGDLNIREVPKDKLPNIQPSTQPTTKSSIKKTKRRKHCCMP